MEKTKGVLGLNNRYIVILASMLSFSLTFESMVTIPAFAASTVSQINISGQYHNPNNIPYCGAEASGSSNIYQICQSSNSGSTASVTVATGQTCSGGECTAGTKNRMTVISNSYYYTFFYNGSNIGWKSSPDGINFLGQANLHVQPNTIRGFASYADNSNNIYMVTQINNGFSYLSGTTVGGGITFNANANITTVGASSNQGMSIFAFSPSNVWVTKVTTATNIEVWACLTSPCTNSGNWSLQKTITSVSTPIPMVWGLSNNQKICVVYVDLNDNKYRITCTTNGGASWSALVATTGTYGSITQEPMSMVNLADTIFVAVGSGGTPYMLKFALGGVSWTETSLSTGNSGSFALTTDGTTIYYIFEDSSVSTTWDFKTTSDGVSFGSTTTLFGSETVSTSAVLTVTSNIVNNKFGVMWTIGTNPYKIRYMTYQSGSGETLYAYSNSGVSLANATLPDFIPNLYHNVWLAPCFSSGLNCVIADDGVKIIRYVLTGNTLNQVAITSACASWAFGYSYDFLGNLWVSCRIDNTIYVLNPTTLSVTFHSIPLYQCTSATDLAVDSVNNVLLTQCGAQTSIKVFKYSLSPFSITTNSSISVTGCTTISALGSGVSIDPERRLAIIWGCNPSLTTTLNYYSYAPDASNITFIKGFTAQTASNPYEFCTNNSFLPSGGHRVLVCMDGSKSLDIYDSIASNTTGIGLLFSFNTGVSNQLVLPQINTFDGVSYYFPYQNSPSVIGLFSYGGETLGSTNPPPPPPPCQQPNPPPNCVNGVDCSNPIFKNTLQCQFNNDICRVFPTGTGSGSMLNFTGRLIGGNINCILTNVGLINSTNTNIKTNGTGYLLCATGLGIMIVLFTLASGGDLRQIPVFVWYVGTIVTIALVTAVAYVDPTILIVTIIIGIAMFIPAIKDKFFSGGNF